METSGRALGFNDGKGRCQIIQTTTQCAIIQVPGIDKKPWNFPPDLFNNRMKGESKP
ncbi:MAG: hypothetical protein ETSY1_43480 [Candidatus Entotheonella factor]|uniref:Uncharacterized protein n=1 Tax=Entotheonella factor TaxID=1429438 RepID=W4L470_ENTF1|nr:MAG: hypothetical protein ETSY1_43480 [Candidatus Entotheonella factor]